MPLFTSPFKCFGPADVAASGTITTDAIPCFGAKQVTVRVRAANAMSFTALSCSSSSAVLPVADSTVIGVGSAVVCSATTNITASQYVLNTTGDTRSAATTVADSTTMLITSTSGLVVGQGLTLSTYLHPGTTITAIGSGQVTLSLPAMKSGAALAPVASRVTLSANANATSATSFTVTVAGGGTPSIATATGASFSVDGTVFTTAAALIGTTAVVEYKAAVGQALGTASGGAYFSFTLGSGVTAAPTLAALPVPYCRFEFVAPSTVSLRGVTVEAFVFGENFAGCY